jgi:hypothetical protein
MIERAITSVPRSPLGGVLLLIVAGALAALALVLGNAHPGVGALFPCLFGLALLWRRGRPFVAQLMEQALEVSEPEVLSLAYGDIEGLNPIGRSADPKKAGGRSYPILIMHLGGVLQIPAHLNVSSEELYRFLYGQLPYSGSRDVNPKLADYLHQHLESFGPERVWSYRARAHRGRGSSGRYGIYWAALALTGIGWMVAAGVLGKGYEEWGGFGGLALTLGLLGILGQWLGSMSGRRSRIKKWRESSLVISPAGLAMVQGEIQGEMKWEELKNVRYRPKVRSWEINVGTPELGVVLVLEGAQLGIANIYDRPLYLIYERILDYWDYWE